MRFHDVIGFGATVETAPGVWDDVVTARYYRGDVIRNTRKYSEGENTVNENLTLGNSISILSDAYLLDNLTDMRYVKWSGSLWKISDVEIQRPRLILRLGGVYNGPTATAPVTP